MRAWLTVATVAAALALTAASSAAQDFAGQVRGYLNDGMAAHTAHGYRADRGNSDFTAAMRLNQPRLFVVNLQSGVNYRIYGACDADCSDLDMEVYDSTGAMIDQDVRMDDTPFVQITPTVTGRAYVRIWLASCETEPCYVGARVVSGGTPEERPAETAGNDGGDYEAGVKSLLDQAQTGFEGEGFAAIADAPENPIEGLTIQPANANQPAGQTATYQLRAGMAYRFAAACDSDCNDIDIEVLDPSGRQVASNVGVDNPTSVDFTPRRDGAYRVRIWLAACSTEPCYAGQRGFQRAAR